MKTSLTKLSSSFLLLSLSFSVWAKPVAQVIEVSGAVFVVTAEGKTSLLKVNQHLDEKSEVMVEEGASITLNDYFDASYQLTGGSHLKIFNKSVQLKKGKAWIQSLNSRHPLALTTANGHVNYWKGEFIASFDQTTSRSQFLVVNGDVEVSNVLDQEMKYTVSAGSFTIVDPEVENGSPRAPTKVGLTSLNSALADFKQVPEKMMEASPARGIASVESVKKGEIIFIRSNRLPASVETSSPRKKVVKKVTYKAPEALVPIRVYGTHWQETNGLESARKPASVQQIAPVIPKVTTPILKNDPEFTSSLKKHASEQPKFSKELENLIEDLKSY